MPPAVAFIGVGANLDGPEQQVRAALCALAALPRTRLSGRSALYRNPPMGPQNQPDFVNAAARLETALAPLELLDQLLALEQAQGRERGERWGPRTLDLDLLLYDAQTIRRPRLTVPHPGIAQRPFVLIPLAEIDPTLEIPGVGRLQRLLEQCQSDHLERIEEPAT